MQKRRRYSLQGYQRLPSIANKIYIMGYETSVSGTNLLISTGILPQGSWLLIQILTDFEYSILYQRTGRQIAHTRYHVFTFIDRNQNPDSLRLSHRNCHCRSHLSQKRIRNHNSYGADDHIHLPAGHNHRVLTRSRSGGSCLDHGGSCCGIGSHSSDLNVREFCQKFLDQLTSQLSALSVYHQNSGMHPSFFLHKRPHRNQMKKLYQTDVLFASLVINIYPFAAFCIPFRLCL